MRKAVFLDRDGTINVEKHYLYKIEDFEFLPGVVEALKNLQSAGYLLVIVTNQSGIGRGLYTEADLEKLNAWLVDTLKEKNIEIANIYYCPHLPDAKIEKYRRSCECRKPGLGMFCQAAEELEIDLDMSYAIGDMLRDCEIAKTTGCSGILVGERENAKVIEQVARGEMPNISYATDLYEAAGIILQKENQ